MASMQTLAQRLLGLTPRELRRALPLFCYLFLTMAGTVASKAARDALFLDRFDATALPYEPLFKPMNKPAEKPEEKPAEEKPAEEKPAEQPAK